MKFPPNEIISLLDERLDYNLAESTNKDLAFGELFDADFLKKLQELKLEYGTSRGNEELRSLIGKKLRRPADNILITNGAVSAIFLSILCLCEQGDEVITVRPNFPPTMDIIQSLGFKRKIVRLKFEDNYDVNIQQILRQITERTKLIILVSPLNPTGTLLSREKVEELDNILANRFPNCHLLIDETYREATYGDNLEIPTFSGLSKRILTCSSLSKCHGTPGLRIGWLCSENKDLLEQMALAKMNTVISNSVLDEAVAIQVLKKEKAIFKSRKIHSKKGFELTKSWVHRNNDAVEWVEPKTGALCCIRLKKAVFDKEGVEDFFAAARKANIQLANGTWFGEERRCFRLGFGYMDIEGLEITLKKLGGILDKLLFAT